MLCVSVPLLHMSHVNKKNSNLHDTAQDSLGAGLYMLTFTCFVYVDMHMHTVKSFSPVFQHEQVSERASERATTFTPLCTNLDLLVC